MVAQRRFGPLVAALFIGLAVILVRLFDVQIIEHEVWAREATNLMRSSKIVPYHRGRILDRNGAELVRDEDVYQVDFSYRDFRRGHPIAQVAHARSALEMRAVPLAEAAAKLEPWACELVLSSPAQLGRFGDGQPIGASPQAPSAKVAASGASPPATGASTQPSEDELARRAQDEQRARRASDLRYYIGELLHVSRAEWAPLRPALEGQDGELSYLELLARARGIAPDKLLAQLKAELAQARADLALLAQLLAPQHGSDPLATLIDDLEIYRRKVEDDAADRLFEEAAGFAPGRLSTESLVACVDTRWIARTLRWDEQRESEWKRSRRALWLRALEGDVLPRILAHVELEESPRAKANRLLSELAALYVPAEEDRRAPGDPPQSWTELDELCVLANIGALFEHAHLPRGFELPRALLPLQDDDVRALGATLDDPWLTTGMVAELCGVHALDPKAPRNAAESAARWTKLSAASLGLESAPAFEELRLLALGLEQRFTTACDQTLRVLLATKGSADAIAPPLELREERRDRAQEQEKFILKDKSNRPVLICAQPSYELVHLLTRSPDRYRGFEVRETTRRMIVARDAQGTPVANQLIGAVRRPLLRELFDQVEDERKLSRLLYTVIRSASDAEDIRELTARLYRSDEFTGGSGVEDYFDKELRGRYGYRETQGLQQRADGEGKVLFQAAVDGKDVTLTLDLGLQLAAQETLAHPHLPSDPSADRLWFENPIGAIVLITPQGEVLAAASEPTVPGLPPTQGRNVERTHVRERTLQRATFNPPGSVFKPFVAAYALDRMGFDPARKFTCLPLPDGGSGYQVMHCHGTHYECDLHRALEVSCNAYFAQLGELFTPEQLLEMDEMFGFGQASGVRHLGTDGRSGLREDWKLKRTTELPKLLANKADAMRFTNGLGLIEATPMQVARATAGVLTGSLPELRLERAIGGVPSAHAARELGISEEHLAMVRKALADVVTQPGGTAYEKGLDRASLGFSFACKTGSADIGPFRDTPEMTPADRANMERGKVRKHTWVAGWFPNEDPKAVLVVYLHDVSETASHTAVYVAAQFLRQPAVRAFVEAATTAQQSAEPALKSESAEEPR